MVIDEIQEIGGYILGGCICFGYILIPITLIITEVFMNPIEELVQQIEAALPNIRGVLAAHEKLVRHEVMMETRDEQLRKDKLFADTIIGCKKEYDIVADRLRADVARLRELGVH